MSDFGRELTRLMVARDIGVRGLARVAYCNPGHISNLRNGKARPSPELAAVLDRVLDAGGKLLGVWPDAVASNIQDNHGNSGFREQPGSGNGANASTPRVRTGREIRALRDALGMSPREFASRIGVSDRAVSKWEAGGEEIITRQDKCAMLDTLLERASEDTLVRFQQFLVTAPETAEPEIAGDLYDIALSYMEPRGMSARALARAVCRDSSAIVKALRGTNPCGPALARDIDTAIGAAGEFIKAAVRAESARKESADDAAQGNPPPVIPIRAERKRRCWTVPTMARKLRAAMDPKEAPDLESLRSNIHRWERGKNSISERYRYLYCQVFGRSESYLFGTNPGETAGIPADAILPEEASGNRYVVLVLPPGQHRITIDVTGTDEENEPESAPRLTVIREQPGEQHPESPAIQLSGSPGTKMTCGGCRFPLSRYNTGSLCQDCISTEMENPQTGGEGHPAEPETILVNGNAIAQARRSRGMTQAFFADRVRLSASLCPET